MLTVWNETNENGDQTGITAIRLVAATNPAEFVSAMGKHAAEGFAIAKASKEG